MINEFNVLQEYRKLKEREDKAREQLKKNIALRGPSPLRENDRIDKKTEYVIKLAKNARER